MSIEPKPLYVCYLCVICVHFIHVNCSINVCLLILLLIHFFVDPSCLFTLSVNYCGRMHSKGAGSLVKPHLAVFFSASCVLTEQNKTDNNIQKVLGLDVGAKVELGEICLCFLGK